MNFVLRSYTRRFIGDADSIATPLILIETGCTRLACSNACHGELEQGYFEGAREYTLISVPDQFMNKHIMDTLETVSRIASLHRPNLCE